MKNSNIGNDIIKTGLYNLIPGLLLMGLSFVTIFITKEDILLIIPFAIVGLLFLVVGILYIYKGLFINNILYNNTEDVDNNTLREKSDSIDRMISLTTSIIGIIGILIFLFILIYEIYDSVKKGNSVDNLTLIVTIGFIFYFIRFIYRIIKRR